MSRVAQEKAESKSPQSTSQQSARISLFSDNRAVSSTQLKQQRFMSSSPMYTSLSKIMQLMSASAQKHVFKGDRNQRLSGFHSKADTDGAELKGDGGTTPVGAKGAYEQNVVDAKFDGPPDKKTKKGGTSSFFPDAMTKDDVISAVDNAVGGVVKAEGKSWDGMKIHVGTGAHPIP